MVEVDIAWTFAVYHNSSCKSPASWHETRAELGLMCRFHLVFSFLGGSLGTVVGYSSRSCSTKHHLDCSCVNTRCWWLGNAQNGRSCRGHCAIFQRYAMSQVSGRQVHWISLMHSHAFLTHCQRLQIHLSLVFPKL